MVHLSIALLGRFEVALDGQPSAGFRTNKVRVLLAYLATEADRAHRRDVLAGLLWPGYAQASALTSLRTALANLRQALGDAAAEPPFLLISPETVQFNRRPGGAASDYVLDVALLRDLPSERLDSVSTDSLRQAADAYRGEFLEGYALADCPELEEWLSLQREYYRRRAREVLQELAERALGEGGYGQAERDARRSLALDAWDERTHRQLMLALALGGQRGAALAQYEACVRALAEGPGVAPEPETTQLYNQIREGQVRGPAQTSLSLRPEQGFLGGRYTVQHPLGEGAKKAAYLAHDTLLDREVALALFKTEGLDEGTRARLRREAQAMARLGAHPHIVTLYDLGEEAGQPFMITEYMAGGSVEQLLAQTLDHRLPLERALEIAVQVCRGLQFAHGKGIVHRDLKPGNVWLTAEGAAKIGDFGLALPLDRPRLTQEGMMVGTVWYMSPEQATGGEVTARSDLYALGCMLYEMVAGRPPFLGDDPVAIIGQHVHTPPVAPSWHNLRCPRDLEALILRLLAKDPAQRPQSAAEVLTALEAVNLSAVAERSEDESRSLDSLAGGVFVGRQREMGELKAALEEALGGHGRLMMLVGEPGIGKTRTALELAIYAGLRQAQVLWGRCYEGQGMPPFWPWVQALRAYVRERAAAQVRQEMGSGAGEIAEIVSEVRERLPDLPAPPPLASPETARFRLFDSISAFLKSAARSQPLVLILDDLHWADKPSLLLLQFLAGELAASRLLVIGCYRDVELSRQHPLAEALGELNRQHAFGRVLLRGLTQEDVGRFIQLTAGVEPPEGLVRAVYEQTEGNPFFVNEVVRLLAQEGELGPEKLIERRSWSVRIPEGVREVVGRRLNRLSERCNEVLTIAAVVGREFTLQQLGRLVEGLSEDRLLEVLEEGLAARVIEELPRAMGRYQFTHALTQETLAEELSLTRRVRLHARIAQALEALYGAHAEQHAGELAHHYGQAEAVLGPEKVVKYSLLAGERALAGYAWEGAMAHFQRGLAAKEGQPMDRETADLLFGLGRAQVSVLERYRAQEAVDTLRRAFDYYLEAGDAARAVAIARYPVPDIHGLTGMLNMVSRALPLASPDSREAGYLLAHYARWVSVERADLAAALDAFERALAIARRHGDAALEMRIEVARAAVRAWNDLNVEDSCRRILELCQVTPDLEGEEEARAWLGHVALHRGRAAEARLHAEAGLAAAERLRDRHRLINMLTLHASLRVVQGDWAGAREFIGRALLVDPREIRVLQIASGLEHITGQWEAGLALLDTGVELMRRDPDQPTSNSWGGFILAWPTLVGGHGEHLELAEASARRVLPRQGIEPSFRWRALLTLGLIAVARGDAQGAAEVYDALKGLQARLWPGYVDGIHRAKARMAALAGRVDEAMGYLEAGIDFLRRANYRPELAWTCFDYADLLLKRSASGDEEKAAALLDEALAIAQELEMRPLVERVQARHKGQLSVGMT